MAYIGKSIESGTFAVLDTSGNTYNGSNTTFSLGTQVGSPAQLLVSHDGVIQKPGTDYTLASGGTQITFSTAPASGASIFIVEISGAVGGPLDSDLNGSELILDTDGDTSITADTDDQIDFKVANADQIKLTDGVLAPSTDNDVDLGTSSLEFKDAFFDGTVTTDGLTVSGTPSFADGSIAIADLDIDGGTDIGADIVDADLFIIDDGAGGTNRKTAASRLKTYIGGGGLVHIATSTASSASSVHLNSVFSSTYDQYFITYAITFSSDAGKARARYQNTSDSEITDTYLQSSVRDSGSSSPSGNYNNTNYFILNDDGQSNFSNIPLHGHMYISNPSSSSIQTQFRNFASTADAGRNSGYEISGGRLQENTAVGGLKIYPDGGTFGSATIRVYGIVNS